MPDLQKHSAEFLPLISRNRANETFRDALRLFVGKGRRFSAKQLSIGTGLGPARIYDFMAPVNGEEYRPPRIEEVLSLMKFLGADFASELLEIAEMGAFELPGSDDYDPSRAAVEAVQDAAEINTLAAHGGKVTDIRDVATRMMVRGANLRAAATVDQPELFGRRSRA